LHCLGDLRELWLQDNKITRITGLENLVNLECLALANNRIADFKDLQRLAHLPALREASFDDPDFGICPVARAEGRFGL
jgi:Leucine-rich repeat (LRR) protein